LPCFGSAAPCRFYEGSAPSPVELARLDKIGTQLWNELVSRLAQHQPDRARLLMRILGRMGSHAPDAFAVYLAKEMTQNLDDTLLFAAGRVFKTPDHAKLFFSTVRLKSEDRVGLTTPWLRVFDYLLFQRPDILESTPREDLVVAIRLCFDSLKGEIKARNFKVKFALSVRAIARLLRTRRHHSDFLSWQDGSSEQNLATLIKLALNDALGLLPDGRDSKGLLRHNYARLCELTRDWLVTQARTDVLGEPDS